MEYKDDATNLGEDATVGSLQINFTPDSLLLIKISDELPLPTLRLNAAFLAFSNTSGRMRTSSTKMDTSSLTGSRASTRSGGLRSCLQALGEDDTPNPLCKGHRARRG